MIMLTMSAKWLNTTVNSVGVVGNSNLYFNVLPIVVDTAHGVWHCGRTSLLTVLAGWVTVICTLMSCQWSLTLLTGWQNMTVNSVGMVVNSNLHFNVVLMEF